MPGPCFSFSGYTHIYIYIHMYLPTNIRKKPQTVPTKPRVRTPGFAFHGSCVRKALEAYQSKSFQAPRLGCGGLKGSKTSLGLGRKAGHLQRAPHFPLALNIVVGRALESWMDTLGMVGWQPETSPRKPKQPQNPKPVAIN